MIKRELSGIIKFILLCPCLVFIFGSAYASNIKEADLAGSWYSDNFTILKREIDNYLKAAKVTPLADDIIALISPHAGLDYSGAVAAYGFKAIANKKVDTVVLVGFSHRVAFDGIAVFSWQGFKTPLGVLAVDQELAEKISAADEKIFSYPQAFANENSIELIVPFIQTVFNQPKVLLLALGRQSWENCKILGEALGDLLKNQPNSLLIASTDMSHYLPLTQAVETDTASIALISKMQPQTLFFTGSGQNSSCGLGPVVSVMIAAKQLGANKLKVLRRSTSAASSGDTTRVVGYLSAAMVREAEQKLSFDNPSLALAGEESGNQVKEDEVMDGLLNDQQRKELLRLARNSIALYLEEGEVLEREFEDQVLREVMGVFVTLQRNHQLRGCIGNIVGTKPLYLGVRDMAIAAACADFRFKAVTKDELKDIHIEISVLSPLNKIRDPDKIILGKHGVLVRDKSRSGVYLPQVATETGWSKEEFLNSLCGNKAGMKPDAWKTGECDIYIFTAEVFGE